MPDTLDAESEVADEVLEPVTTEIADFNQITASLQEMRETAARAKWDLETTGGDKAARQFRAKCVTLRTTLTKAAKDLGDDMRQRLKLIGSERDRLIELVREIEDPIDTAIKDLEARKAAEREAKRHAEELRVSAIAARIQVIKDAPSSVVGEPSGVIHACIEQLETMLVDESYEEFKDRAESLRASALQKLRGMLSRTLEDEAKAAALAAEQAAHAEKVRKFEELRLRQEQEQQERDRIAAEAQARIDAENARIERERAELVAAKEAQARAEKDAAEREARAERDRIAKAEADRLAAIEAAAQAERDRLAAIEKEKADKAAAAAEKKRQADEAKRAEDLAKAKRMAQVGDLGYDLAGKVLAFHRLDGKMLPSEILDLASMIVNAVEAVNTEAADANHV